MRILLLTCLLLACAVRASDETLKKDIPFSDADEILKLDAYMPDGAGPFPICVAVHGGGWTKGDKALYTTKLYEPLRKAGYVVFSINYRLSPKHHYPAMADDVTAGIKWAKAHAAEYKGDAAKIALVGDSAGGYLVCHEATLGKEAVQAVVVFYGPTNLESRVRNTGKLLTAGALTGLTEVNEETFKKLHEISPINFIKPKMPPFFMLHGDKDAMVPIAQTVEFQQKMRDAGNTCDFITVPGGAHGIYTWDKLEYDYRTPVIEWLGKNLK